MDIKADLLFSKTLKGIDAARGRGAITPALLTLLRLVDGTRNTAALVAASGKSMAEGDVQAVLTELLASGFVRVVERSVEPVAKDSVTAEAERRLLETLDFTALPAEPPTKPTAAKPPASAPSTIAPPPVPAAMAAKNSNDMKATGPAAAPEPVISQEERARKAHELRLKLEADIRQKFTAAH